jgi:TPR repeat protein
MPPSLHDAIPSENHLLEDVKTLRTYFGSAPKAGHARAVAWVGYLLAAGPGTGGAFNLEVRPNAQRAARWYAKAAQQGLPSAMYDYGVVLEHGMGIPVDEAAARQWYQKAAEKGFPAAAEALMARGRARP